MEKVRETAFKALEYYESDLVRRVEAERDEALAERDKAQAYASHLKAQTEILVKRMDLRLRLEKMIQDYLLSEDADPDALIAMIDKMVELDREVAS